jgi:shikimate dehydrogenase
MSISGSARLAGIVGWPVSHSLSPLLHGAWLKEYEINGAFVPLAVRREDFARAIHGLKLCGFRGINVTVPHKEAAFALAHRCDAEAQAAGAANLLLFDAEGRYEARNTDSLGLAASLRLALGAKALRGKPVVLIGAGGAARAAIRALDRLGASRITIFNRTESRGQTLVRDLSAQVQCQLFAEPLSKWGEVASGVALLVNATSAGMKGQQALRLPLDPLEKRTAVCDLVYNPLETSLLKAARKRGHKTVDGLGMLIEQAVPAFEAFFGRKPKVTPKLRRMLEKALLHG